MRHEDLWGSRFIGPLIIDLGTSLRWVVSFATRLLDPLGNIPRYPLDRRLGGPQSRSGPYGENSLSQARIEPCASSVLSLYRLSSPGSPSTSLRSSVFWNITLCSPLKVKRRFGGTCHFHLQSWRIKPSKKLLWSTGSEQETLLACVLLGILLNPEDGDDIFFRNVAWLSPYFKSYIY
jgi:hypothetical protein